MKEKLLGILDDIRPDIDFTLEQKLMEDGILDSFDILSIVSAIEESFAIEVGEDDLETVNFNSVDAMIRLIVRLKESK